MSVGLVVVSHSNSLSNGVAEVAGQMAPDVQVLPAGGLPGGEAGTDFELVSTALSDADTGSGTVLLYDLGSALMTAELAVEALGDPSKAIVVHAPLVEGAVAAAVAAQGDRSMEEVARAAEQAAHEKVESEVGVESGDEVSDEIELRNEIGLHARPAALLARSLTGLKAGVTVAFGDKEADGTSVLGVMGLGARKGDRITVRATGQDARRALDQILDLVHNDFGE